MWSNLRAKPSSNNKQERDSNFEILRIVAMMMIILHHIALYGGWPLDVGQTFNLSIDSFFIQFIHHFGKIGVWIFVLITGYYMVCSKSQIIPKFLKLFLQIYTTSVLVDVIFIVFGGVPANSIHWQNDLLPVLSGKWWFASTYLIALPFFPFVNKMLNSLDRGSHLTLILLLLIVWFVIPTFTHSGMYGSFVIMFFTMYTIGAYIKLYPKSFERSVKEYGLWTIISITLLATLIALANLIGPLDGFKPFETTLAWGNDSSIMVVIIAVLTFLTFKQTNVGHIHWVNVFASTMFGVYLLQEHDQFRAWIFEWMDIGNHYGSPDLILYVFGCMLVILVLCAILEYVRMQTVDRATSRLIPPFTKAIRKTLSCLVGTDNTSPQ